MNRIANVIVMQAKDRMTWFLTPAIVLGALFAFVLLLTLSINSLWGGATPIYTGALAGLYIVMLGTGINAVTGMFPLAVGFGARRRDYVLGTMAMGGAVCAAWAILLGLLSLVEADVIKNWGVGLHFFHLPFFSDGSPLRQFCWSYYHDLSCTHSDPNYLSSGLPLGQFWVYFVLLLFMYLLGLVVGSIYQRFGRTGIYALLGIALLPLIAFLLVSSHWSWWGAIFGWLGQQTAAGLAWWLLPLAALFALASYALLRKATI